MFEFDKQGFPLRITVLADVAIRRSDGPVCNKTYAEIPRRFFIGHITTIYRQLVLSSTWYQNMTGPTTKNSSVRAAKTKKPNPTCKSYGGSMEKRTRGREDEKTRGGEWGVRPMMTGTVSAKGRRCAKYLAYFQNFCEPLLNPWGLLMYRLLY